MIAALALAGLVLAAGLSARFGVPGAVALAAMSVLWLLVNGPMEGPVLVRLSKGHGITGADLASIVGLGLAALQVTHARRRGSA